MRLSRAIVTAPWFAPSVAAGGAVLSAVVAGGAPTGTPGLDVAARALLTVGFVVAALRAGRVARVGAAAILVLAMLSDPATIPLAAAAGALGLALADLATRSSGPVSRSCSGFLLGFVALRLPPGPTGSSAAIVVAVLSLLVASAAVRATNEGRRRVVWAVVLGAAAFAIISIVFAVAAVSARTHIESGMDATRLALDETRAGRTAEAAAAFDDAERAFSDAHALVANWWTEPARLLPVVGHYREVASELTSSGVEIAAAGARLARTTDPDVTLKHGRVSIAAVRALEPPLAGAATALARAADRLDAIDRTWLLSPISHQIDELATRVQRALDETTTGLEAARVLPGVLGGDGARKYFVAFQTPAEQRAAGGIIGNYAVVTFDDGAFDLAHQGRDTDLNTWGLTSARTLAGPADYVRRYATFDPARTWQNVTMSPDFPSVAQVIEGLAPQSGAGKVDGVVTIDPRAVAALLELTGPISVPNLSFQLTAANAEQFLLHDQYLTFASNGARIDFLGDTIDALVQRLRTATLPAPARIAEVLGPVVREGRIAMHSTRPTEQKLFARTGADGAFPKVEHDFVGLVTQNASGNKIDVFQRRALHYDATVDPATGAIKATAEITLHNDAPRTGLPHYVIGGSGSTPTTDGDSRIYVSLYSPLALRSARLGSTPLEMQGAAELGRNVYSAMVLVPAHEFRTITLELEGTAIASRDHQGGYALTVWRQPTIRPDGIEIKVRRPDGTPVLRGAGQPEATTTYVGREVR